MAIVGLIIALVLFWHYKKRLAHYRRSYQLEDEGGAAMRRGLHSNSWHDQWHRHWADKFTREAERRQRDWERYAKRSGRRSQREARRHARRRDGICGFDAPDLAPGGETGPGQGPGFGGAGDAPAAGPPSAGAAAASIDGFAHPSGSNPASPDRASSGADPGRQPGGDGGTTHEAILRRARRRAAAEVGFYGHLMSYLGVIAFLALINVFTTRYPWFLWPAMGWGIGLFSHWMAVFGSRHLRRRYFDPAVEREVRRETMAVRTEKQASIDELSATIAHEIRNPIAAAKSLVQQMGEDPHSIENVEYAQVAMDELDRVERSISHLLRYAKEEDLHFAPVNLAGVLDSALTTLKAKLEAAGVSVSRNYIGGPTLIADGEKLRQVFANILDNAIDALQPVVEDRRVELFVENGVPSRAKVRIRDNGAGIAPDKLERIFNPFFTTKEKGTGLGMAISKKIVEAHEGTIDVVSEPGQGTEFVVTLPLAH
jgi:signal transduction histidine kinase